MEEEYKMLREEIMFNLTKMHWYVSIVSTVAVALLAYILQNIDNIALISVFLATLVVIEGRIYSVTKSNLRISTYMEVFLEPNLENRNWETYSFLKERNIIPQTANTDSQNGNSNAQTESADSHNDETDSRNVKEKGVVAYISGINTACLLIGLIPFIFNCVALPKNLSLPNMFLTILNAIFILSLLTMSFVYMDDKDESKRDKYIKHWKNIKTNLNEGRYEELTS